MIRGSIHSITHDLTRRLSRPTGLGKKRPFSTGSELHPPYAAGPALVTRSSIASTHMRWRKTPSLRARRGLKSILPRRCATPSALIRASLCVLNSAFPGAALRRAPAYTSVRGILQQLDPNELEQAFPRHAERLDSSCATAPSRFIAIDGKTLHALRVVRHVAYRNLPKRPLRSLVRGEREPFGS